MKKAIIAILISLLLLGVILFAVFSQQGEQNSSESLQFSREFISLVDNSNFRAAYALTNEEIMTEDAFSKYMESLKSGVDFSRCEYRNLGSEGSELDYIEVICPYANIDRQVQLTLAINYADEQRVVEEYEITYY